MCDQPQHRVVLTENENHRLEADDHAVRDGFLYLTKAKVSVAVFAPGRWSGVLVKS